MSPPSTTSANPVSATFKPTFNRTHPEMAHVYAPLPASGAPPPNSIHALQSHPVVVVGAGPVGLLAAAMLAHRALDVIVVERTDLSRAAAAANLTRAYTIALSARAHRVLALCPGLSARVAAASVGSDAFRIDGVDADGKPTQLLFGARGEEGVEKAGAGAVAETPPALSYILRARLVALLYDYVSELRNVVVLDNTELSALRFRADGTTSLRLTGRHRDAELVSRLVLACDGRNSPTLAALRADTSGALASAHGLGEVTCVVPSSGKLVKSVVVTAYGRDAVRSAHKAHKGELVPESAGLSFGGLRRGRPARSVFSLAGLPIAACDRAVLCGELCSIMARPEHAIFGARDVDDAYALLQENFPQLDARKAFTRDSLQAFVDDRDAGWPLGPVRRVSSLAVTVGAGDAGGLVLLGEAAHSFPPDMGQGLNSGVEDVGVLMGVLDRCEPDATAGSVAREYERVRGTDIVGLVFVHRVAARWQLGQPLDFAAAKWLAGMLARNALASVLPSVFDPPVGVLLQEPLSYGETMRRAERTTRRIWVMVVLLSALVSGAMLALMAL